MAEIVLQPSTKNAGWKNSLNVYSSLGSGESIVDKIRNISYYFLKDHGDE